MQLLHRFVLRAAVQESLHRYQFFYTAFQYLSFNGIDGDYAEFGCHGGRTFSMAYHQIRRHRLSARLWAYDSFQGLPPQASGRDEHPVWRAGNMHTPLEESIDFDAAADDLGITEGETYPMDIFHAERHTVESNFRVETTIDLSCIENVAVK